MNDVYPKVADVITLSNGFFNHIPFNFPPDITKASLDFQFYTRYSEKNTAPVVNLLVDGISRLTDAQLDTIGQAIWQTYNRKWSKQLAVYSIEYNPIYNYTDEYHETNSKISSDVNSKVWLEEGSSNIEKETGLSATTTIDDDKTRTDNLTERLSKGTSVTSTRTDNLSEQQTKGTSNTTTRTDNLTELQSKGTTSTATRTDNLSELETRNLSQQETRNLAVAKTDNSQNSVFGFNSSNAVGNTVDQDTANETNTGTVNTINTGTVSTDNTGTQENVIAETGSDTVTNTGTQQTVSNNSGYDTITNTGTQQTLSSESGSDSTTKTGTQTISDDITKQESSTTSVTDSKEDTRNGVSSHADDYSESGDKDYTHIGNIGNHPTQHLISKEIELWRWNFVEELLNDVKDFVTIPVYLC